MSEGKYKLFLSHRIVLENEEFDGGVLVDDYGRIESILDRSQVDELLGNNSDGSIEVIDGGNLALLAGVVDSHVHVNEPGRTSWEGFHTASAAAAAGGITTIVDMPLNAIPPTTTLENLKIKAAAAESCVFTDVAFWGGVVPGNQDSLRDLVAAGVVGFKCFLCPSGVEEFPMVEKRDLETALTVLEGTGTVLAFHAELEQQDTSTKDDSKDPEQYSTYLQSRPKDMELNAISLITSLLPKTNVRVHIVHVSSAEVIPLLEAARCARLQTGNKDWCAGITAETCHHYLTLNSESIPPGHSEYKCAPPIREEYNKERLWQYLSEDKINLVVSDHSPCTCDLKCTNILQAWGGISSLQFGLSLFWTEACARGMGLSSVSKYLSKGPATLCGDICTQKGALRPGFDADMVFFDPDATFCVTSDIILHKNKLTPYLGQNLRGKVIHTYLRGRLIFSNGEHIGQPIGKLLLKNM